MYVCISQLLPLLGRFIINIILVGGGGGGGGGGWWLVVDSLLLSPPVAAAVFSAEVLLCCLPKNHSTSFVKLPNSTSGLCANPSYSF